MAFNDNASTFNDQKVIDFSVEKGILNPEITYRIRTDWDTEADTEVLFKAFMNDPNFSKVKNFIIGMWVTEAYEIPPTKLVNLIVESKDKLQHIEGIFFGDITYMENEVSWIYNCDHGVILDALPNLQVYQVRGGNGLSLGTLNHPNLKKLIIESGGLPANIFAEIANAKLPKLEHLELWIGTEGYGLNASPEQVAAAYRGAGDNHLPSLKYLGLRNSEDADKHALLFQNDNILKRIEVLDLSKGTFGDEGAHALINNPDVKKLKKIDLTHNFVSDEWAAKLGELGLNIILEEREPNPGEYDRYVEVGE